MILVTGGTGFVGSHLLFFLLKENETVRAIHRKNSSFEGVKEVFSYYTEDPESYFSKIKWVEADITDIPSLSEAFIGITNVYHTAAYISFNPEHYYKLKKANIEGTANVVNLCLKNGVRKLCYTSSIATIGTTLDGSIISEEAEWNPEEKNSVYAISKYGAEMEVWRGTQEGLDAVIVNPGVIFGSGFWNSGSGVIIKMADKQLPFYPSGGIGIVDVQDVVLAMILLQKSDIKNRRFILVSKNISYQNLLSEICKRLGKKAPKQAISKWKLLSFCNIDWFISRVFGTRRKLLKAMVHSMYTTSFYDANRLKTELDFKFKSYEESLSRIVTNYCKES